MLNILYNNFFKKTDGKKIPVGFWFLIIGAGVVIDQTAKIFIREPFKNYHFAFSLPVPGPVMYLIYILVVGVVCWYIIKNYKLFTEIQFLSWSLILAGALSNIGERVFLGYVRDFIYLFGGILNIADFYILCGAFLLLLQEFKIKRIRD